MPTWEGVRGVLPAGPGASPAPQCQLQPGQGLYNEAHHQLPADEETSQHWSVSVDVKPVSGPVLLCEYCWCLMFGSCKCK